MKTKYLGRALIGLAALTGVLLLSAPAMAQTPDPPLHGISFTKGCQSPTKIGDPMTCSYAVRNITDEAEDTLTFDALVDIVHSAGGDVNSGNVIGSVQITVQNGATCAAAGGDGSVGNPYTGVTSCTLPFNGRANILPFSHYTVQAGDFGLPGSALVNDAFLTWHDVCNGTAGQPPFNIPGGGNCVANPPPTSASSQTIVLKLASATTTAIHDAGHNVVLSVPEGTTVHDFVTVTGEPGKPAPTGDIVLEWFTNGNCTPPAASTSAPIALTAGGTVDATSFPQGPLAAGSYSFMAHYLGSATYNPSDGPCEPLEVTPAPPGGGAFTPGYWKNHQEHLVSLLPIALGGYTVDTFTKGRNVFNGMNCGASKAQDAVGCLAGHLLAAKLNVANGSSTCIAPAITAGDAFLVSIGYTGPAGTYNLSATQRAQAIAIKNQLDFYNNNGSCI